MGIRLPPKQLVQGQDSIALIVEDDGKVPGGRSYFVEYVLFISFRHGTDKISQVREFQDSAYVNETFKGWGNK
ncbi:hypothetical protein C8R47DRAFT_1001785 [Mycena vitilis]|nr:hypothetical protein C8R47DRAFT_1001785 [Mycena vitilis]